LSLANTVIDISGVYPSINYNSRNLSDACSDSVFGGEEELTGAPLRARYSELLGLP